MVQRSPSWTRTVTLFPYTTLFRSPPARSWRFPSGRSAGRAASWAKDRGWLDDGVDALIDDQCGLVEQDAEIAGDRRKIGGVDRQPRHPRQSLDILQRREIGRASCRERVCQ